MRLRGLFLKRDSTKSIAKDRLKLVLINDRLNFKVKVLDTLKLDIISVISNHIHVDAEELDLQFSQNFFDNRRDGFAIFCAYVPNKNIKNKDK